MDPKVDYRRLVEAKLTALGVDRGRASSAKAAPARRRNEARDLRRASVSPLALCGALAARWLPASGTDKPKPRPLEPLTPQNVAAPAWNQRIDGVQFPLDGRASRAARSPSAAQRRQRARARGRHRPRALAHQRGGPLSAGVGSDGRFAAVVTRDGELVALEAGQIVAQGDRLARRHRAARGRRAGVRARRRPHACRPSMRKTAASCGLQRPGDPLTLRQTGVLSAFKDTLVVGQGPRLAGSTRPTARCAGRCRSARRAAPTKSSGWPTWWARRARRQHGCARALPGRAWAASMRDRGERCCGPSNGGGTEAVGGDREFVFGADATRPHHGLAQATTAKSPGRQRSAALPRPDRAASALGGSVVVGDAGARCTCCRATRARRCCACRPTAAAIAAPPVVVGQHAVRGHAQRRHVRLPVALTSTQPPRASS